MISKYITLLVGLSALITHFTIVGLSLMPDNPLKHQYKYQIAAYINPLFSQSWCLFSPTPVNTNMTILVQFKSFDNGAIRDTTNWVDLYQPLIEEKRNNFWSPVQRVSKFMTSIMQNISEHNNTFFEDAKKDSLLSKNPEALQKAYEKNLQNCMGHNSLLQYSNFVFDKMHGTQMYLPKGIDSVQVRYQIFDSEFPRFSKRNLDYFDLNNYKFSKSTSNFYTIKKQNT